MSLFHRASRTCSLPPSIISSSSSSRLITATARANIASSSSRRASSNMAPPRFSEGENASTISRETDDLIKNGWTLCEDGMGLEKTYYFTNYTKTLDLVHGVGVASKSKNHHSTMIVKYGSLHIQWTTHSPRGLSSKDTDMARYTDDQAKMIGTVERKDSKNCSTGPSKN